MRKIGNSFVNLVLATGVIGLIVKWYVDRKEEKEAERRYRASKDLEIAENERKRKEEEKELYSKFSTDQLFELEKLKLMNRNEQIKANAHIRELEIEQQRVRKQLDTILDAEKYKIDGQRAAISDVTTVLLDSGRTTPKSE